MGTKTSKNGFTLVEVVIVVAIIGILSLFAVPQFYKYRAKARQTEVFSTLANMYGAEKMFYAEQKTFTMCLNQIGYSPGSRDRYYTAGFLNAGPMNCGKSGTWNCFRVNFNGPNPAAAECSCAAAVADEFGGLHNDCTWNATRMVDPSYQLQNQFYTWSASRDTFTVGGIGQIRATPQADVWQMDQNKILQHLENGE